MGNWFENMEPMDIQAERANTKREKERADQAEEERDKAEEEREQAEIEREQAEQTLRETVEKNIKSTIKLIQEFSGTKQMAVEKLVELQGMSRNDAKKMVEKYWN